MKMKEFEFKDFKITQLNPLEIFIIQGGEIPWTKVWKYADKLSTALGIADAIDRFVDGFNAGNCD